MSEKACLSCVNCSIYNCRNRNAKFPAFCPTENKTSNSEVNELNEIYKGDSIDGRMACAAAQIEGNFYRQKTRVEETVLFIQKIGAKRVGIATCFGLINEAKVFAAILKKNNIEYTSVICKVGGEDKCNMGLSPEDKICKGEHFEAMCNPILQARILNRAHTDLNIAIGLCVGHDALFSKYSDAPVTTLIVKDRVLGHNPVAALYTHYYRDLYK